MSNRGFWLFVLLCALLAVAVKLNDGYKVFNHDLEVAASEKKEWEKGDDEDHYAEEHDSKGEKAEKGYKGEHE